jgi:hypothetical protein
MEAYSSSFNTDCIKIIEQLELFDKTLTSLKKSLEQNNKNYELFDSRVIDEVKNYFDKIGFWKKVLRDMQCYNKAGLTRWLAMLYDKGVSELFTTLKTVSNGLDGKFEALSAEITAIDSAIEKIEND